MFTACSTIFGALFHMDTSVCKTPQLHFSREVPEQGSCLLGPLCLHCTHCFCILNTPSFSPRPGVSCVWHTEFSRYCARCSTSKQGHGPDRGRHFPPSSGSSAQTGLVRYTLRCTFRRVFARSTTYPKHRGVLSSSEFCGRF